MSSSCTGREAEDDNSKEARTISLQIPEGAEAGDALTFEVDGNEIEIPIPEGSKPGDVLEIQVGGDDNHTASDDRLGNDSSVVTIVVDGKTLEFSTACKEKVAATATKEADGTNSHPWPSGMAMADFWASGQARDLLHSLFSRKGESGTDSSQKGLKVLELGSGLGLVGLSFVAHYTNMMRAASSLPPLGNIVLSDVPDGIALLKQNIELNASLFHNHSVEARPLLWTEEEIPNQVSDRYHLVLASDVLYNTKIIPALVSTIKRHLETSTKDSSALLLAVRWRKPEQERSFFKALDGWQGKKWHLVHTLHSPLSWREYGNPNCEASNLYFHQTMVSVQGKPHSLAQILSHEATTNDNETKTNGEDKDNSNNARPLQEEMTDQEADVFEKCHIQIYCLSNMDPTTSSNKAGSSKRSAPSSGACEESENPKRSCGDS